MINELIQFRRMVRKAGDGKTLVPTITSVGDSEGGLFESVRIGKEPGEGKSIVLYQRVNIKGARKFDIPVQWKVEGIEPTDLTSTKELTDTVGEILLSYGAQVKPALKKSDVVFSFPSTKQQFILRPDKDMPSMGTFIL